ncbi:DUF1570 domain-containing protein [Bremerella sp. JC817]|uniref:DUF1570 domain-containing protein n=1 Tax=Bremerella sp. JC817 TaxID=3231756 RepID=UPI0034596C15
MPFWVRQGMIAAALLSMAWPLLADGPGLLQDIPTDQMTMRDGSVLRGMLLDESPRGYEFIEINRPPGKPSFAVIHTIGASQVQRLEKVGGDERRILDDAVNRLRNHTQIRAAAKESLKLTRVQSDVLETDQAWRYEGDRFTLLSPLDEELTRSLAVRADQIFQAFEHWIPPKQQPQNPIQIIVFRSIGSYSAYLKTIGLQIENPAVYVPHTNQVLIGSDLGLFQQRLDVVQRNHDAVLQQLDADNKKISGELKLLAKRLKDAGWSPNEIAPEVQSMREAWERDYKKRHSQIQVTNRRNATIKQELLDSTTGFLCHESFHAYIENCVYPQDRYDVPVWLNEGLAQLFEHAQFDNGSFRIDLPPAKLLGQLQDRIERDHGMSLQRMLQTEGGSFLLFENLHGTRLDYDVAWGLAWYLVFQKQLFAPNGLQRYVHARDKPQPTIEETFGESVSRVQSEWVEFISQLQQ